MALEFPPRQLPPLPSWAAISLIDNQNRIAATTKCDGCFVESFHYCCLKHIQSMHPNATVKQAILAWNFPREIGRKGNITADTNTPEGDGASQPALSLRETMTQW